jgi:hypothetical protein
MNARAASGLTVGALAALNGVAMIAAPHAWYAAVPGVAEHGAFNAHFVRDIGAANLLAGAALIGTVLRPVLWPAALLGGLFLAVHAAFHAAEAIAGHVAPATALLEVPLLGLTAALAVWSAWPAGRDVT